MRTGAGIVGILWGLISFVTFGFVIGGIGSAAGQLSVQVVGFGLPLITIAGGIASFKNGPVGGVLLVFAAVGYLLITGANGIGLMLAGPVGIAGLLAFAGAESDSTAKSD